MIRFCEIYHKYEFSDVVDALVRPSGSNAFIGISDIASEGTFVWINEDTATIEELGFHQNEPNNEGNEDCLELGLSNTLNDRECTDTVQALCERLLD